MSSSQNLAKSPRGRRRIVAGAVASAVLGTLGIGAVAAATPAVAAPATHTTSTALQQVVVTGDGSLSASKVAALVAAVGGTKIGTLSLVDGVSAHVPADAVAGLRATPGIRSVTSDTGLHLLADNWSASSDQGSLQQVAAGIGASTNYAKGLTGTGIGVALVDSGVSPVAGLTEPGSVIQGPDLSFDSQAANLEDLDGFGHGTHMAGIIAGRDPGSLANPTSAANFTGIAPGSHVVSIKVAAADGATDVSQVIAGIDWAVQHKNDPGVNIRVLNLSFGTDSTQSYLLDPLAFAAEQAWRHGIVVVVAAGNDGNDAGSLTDPAIDPDVIAVGASTSNGTASTADDSVAAFSSGVTAGNRTPDLVAPGTSIDSLRDPGSYIDTNFTTGRITTPSAPGNVDSSRLFRGSGTSQATAVTSGAAALLLQQRPNLSPDQVKSLLTSTAQPLAGATRLTEGSGLLNIAKAIAAPTPIFATQLTLPATGLGTLEGARGGDDLADPTTGAPLTGNVDIFGHAWNSAAVALATITGTAWNGGDFMSSHWSGNAWDSSHWSASHWSSSHWSNITWSSNDWAGQPWSTADYTSATWSAGHWSGDLSSSHWSAGHWSAGHWSVGHWSAGHWSAGHWSAGHWSTDGFDASHWSMLATAIWQ